jgi:hypothetical protein
MFSNQDAFCRICAKPVRVTAAWLRSKHGCCSRSCLHELEWRYTLSILGKEYYPDPNPVDEKDDYLIT